MRECPAGPSERHTLPTVSREQGCKRIKRVHCRSSRSPTPAGPAHQKGSREAGSRGSLHERYTRGRRPPRVQRVQASKYKTRWWVESPAGAAPGLSTDRGGSYTGKAEQTGGREGESAGGTLTLTWASASAGQPHPSLNQQEATHAGQHVRDHSGSCNNMASLRYFV